MGTWGGASRPSTGSGSAAGKGRRLTAGLACLAREQEQVLDDRIPVGSIIIEDVMMSEIDLESVTIKIEEELARKAYPPDRSEEHTSELQSLMRISYAVFCLKKKNI